MNRCVSFIVYGFYYVGLLSSVFGVSSLVNAMEFTHNHDQEMIAFTLGHDDLRQNHFVFDKRHPVITQPIPKNSYSVMVEQAVMCCVDVFVYNPQDKTYFMVYRTNKPAEKLWWYPGGRLLKHESFFACAQRKCREEVGITISESNMIQLGSYSTTFDDSAWGPAGEEPYTTHTVNTAVLAFYEPLVEQVAATGASGNLSNITPQVQLDNLHGGMLWVSIDQAPENPYLKAIWAKARKKIARKEAEKNNMVVMVNNNVSSLARAFFLRMQTLREYLNRALQRISRMGINREQQDCVIL